MTTLSRILINNEDVHVDGYDWHVRSWQPNHDRRTIALTLGRYQKMDACNECTRNEGVGSVVYHGSCRGHLITLAWSVDRNVEFERIGEAWRIKEKSMSVQKKFWVVMDVNGALIVHAGGGPMRYFVRQEAGEVAITKARSTGNAHFVLEAISVSQALQVTTRELT